MNLVSWNIASEEKLLVGMLHCVHCVNGVVDIMFGGKECAATEEALENKCPECGKEEGNYWVNDVYDWEARLCLFVAGEVEL